MQAGVRGLVLASVAVAMLTAAGGVHVEVFPDGARYEGELLRWPSGVNGEEDDAMGMFLAGMVLLAVVDGRAARRA